MERFSELVLIHINYEIDINMNTISINFLRNSHTESSILAHCFNYFLASSHHVFIELQMRVCLGVWLKRTIKYHACIRRCKTHTYIQHNSIRNFVMQVKAIY